MTINKEWIDWINLNISRGGEKEGIYEILIDEGFDPSDIEKQMGYQPKVDIEDIPIYTSCLLYTSPSPRDLSTSRMPSSA